MNFSATRVLQERIYYKRYIDAIRTLDISTRQHIRGSTTEPNASPCRSVAQLAFAAHEVVILRPARPYPSSAEAHQASYIRHLELSPFIQETLTDLEPRITYSNFVLLSPESICAIYRSISNLPSTYLPGATGSRHHVPRAVEHLRRCRRQGHR